MTVSVINCCISYLDLLPMCHFITQLKEHHAGHGEIMRSYSMFPLTPCRLFYLVLLMAWAEFEKGSLNIGAKLWIGYMTLLIASYATIRPYKGGRKIRGTDEKVRF